MRKFVLTLAVLTIVLPVRAAFAAGDDGAPPPAPDTRTAPPPGSTRFMTRGGETVEGKIIDRLPNGYLVRLPNDTTRVVVYEDVASVDGAAPPPQAQVAPPPPAPVQPLTPAVMYPLNGIPAPDIVEPFGRAGQVILRQGFGFLRHTENTTTIVLDPSFHFLVTDFLTVGFELAYARTSTKIAGATEASSSTSTSNDLGGEVIIGFVARLSDGVSLWPNVSSGISHDFDGKGSSMVLVGGQLAILFHPSRHFFIALEPEFRGTRSLEGSGQTFDYTEGLGTGIGGWW